MVETPSLTAALVDCVMDIAGRPLPEDIGNLAALSLLDFSAAVLAGAGAPEAALADAALAAFGTGEAFLIARNARTSSFGAAFFHGFVATIADIDDAHRYASGLHMSATTFPAALALGEERGCDADLFFRAIVAGYEASSRLCRAADAGFRARGFHSTGVVGPIGTAAAISVLLGLDSARTRHALCIAASGAGGLLAFQAEGATVRHAHSGWASVNGLTAALMAEVGATGPSDALGAETGLLSAYAEDIDPGFITAPLPSVSGRYEIENAYRKLYFACGHSLPALSAVLTLRDELAGRPDLTDPLGEIEAIEIRCYAAAARLTNPHPESVGEAKFSLPFIVAMALVFGDVGADQMRREIIAREDVKALAARVTVIEDADLTQGFPDRRSSIVTMSLSDGSRLSARDDAPKGMPENPASISDIELKFSSALAQSPAQVSPGDRHKLPFIRTAPLSLIRCLAQG